MLGKSIKDPHHVEAGGEIAGMGLLPMDTIFAAEKTRTRVSGKFQTVRGILSGLSGVSLEGYEIHMGPTKLEKGEQGLTEICDTNTQSTQKTEGAQKGNIYGSYVHGIFDKGAVASEVVRSLAAAKGIEAEEISSVDFQQFKETQYDILADELRKHLDMERIYQILEKK